MSNTLGSLVIELGASVASLQSDFARAQALTDKAVGDLNLKINSIGSGANFSGVSSKVQGLTGDFASLRNTIAGLVGLDISIGGLEKLAGLADDYQNVSNRIRSTVSDSQQLVAIQQQLFEVAQQTGTELDATAKMYQRLEQVIEGTGKSQLEAQAEAIALTKTLNQEIVVSGVSSAEASRAIMDLVHGLAGGELQARQFNQIIRQFPDLAKQLADGLGVTSQQLEKMVHAGLPAEQVLKALAVQSAAIETRFNALPVTFARAWTQLSNAVEKYVGEAAQGSVISEALKNSIIGIANHINIAATGAEAVGVAIAAWLGGRTLQGLNGMVSALGDMVTAQGAYKTAAILSAEADIANAAAIKTAAAATIAKADATNDLRIVELAELQAKQESLIAEQALLEAQSRAMPIQFNMIAGEERLIAVRTELTGTTARLVDLENAMAASQARATLAEQAEAAATVELAAAKTALAGAQAEATAATGLLARAGSGLLAAVGGLPTLLLAAGAGVLYLASRESELSKEADALNKITNDLTRAHAQLTPALAQTAEAAYKEAQANLQQAQASLVASEATTRLSIETRGLANFNSNNSAHAKAAADVTRLTAAINELTGAYIKAKLAAAGKSLWESMFPDLRSALAQIDALTEGVDKQTAHFQQIAATYGKGNAALVEYQKSQELTKLSLGQSAEAIVTIKKALDEKYAADIAAARSADAVTAATKEQHKELTAQEHALKAYQSDLGKLTDLEEQLASGMAGPYLSALRTYQKEIDLTAKTWADAKEAGTATDELINRLSDDQERAREHWQRANEQIKAQHDQFASLNEQLKLQETLLHTAPQYQAAVTAGMQAYNAALKAGVDLYGEAIPEGKEIKEVLDAQLPTYVQLKQRVDEMSVAVKNNNEITKQWQQIAVSGFDSVGNSIAQFATGGIKTWHDFGQSLVGDAKQFIAAIIQQFLKLTVFNGIINSLFGLSGSSAMPTGLGNGMLGSIFGGGGGMAGASAGGSSPMASGLFSPSSWSSAGQNMFGGFQSAMEGAGNLWSKATGAYTYSSPIMTGPSASLAGEGASGAFAGATAGGAASYVPTYGGYGSALGQGLGIAGGVVAGYNEFKTAGGGAAGIAGGVAYGVGTYFAGAAVTAGLGAAAAGGLSAGMAAGMAAIPVVGWIALAAMAINMISGGKLFGTAATKFVSGASTETITATGADIDTKATYKGQRALFGGSYTKTKDIPVSAEAEKAADDFFAALKKGQTEFVSFFGDTLKDQVDIVGGTFVTTFDKHGKATGTSDTVLGVTRKETDQQFAERLQADSYLAVLDKMGIGASAFVAGLQDDADKLFAGVQDLASVAQNAFTNLGKGFRFMALGADETLPEVMKFVIGLNQGGETLSQTYQRLMQAQQQYDQFVAQFKPASTYVDPFEASLSNLYHQMLSAEEQANALAIASGADGASLTDLANISKSFAGQMAQAVIQLEASAQQLAFSLGLTLMGSLDQINGEIARLTGGNAAATSSINNFGNAITETAQKADAALNLMLGNLSPLNDQQKLQLALQGLRAGTVSADQVLGIGRSLYASSQAYTDLFNQVMPYAGQQAAGGGSSYSGGSTSTDHTQILSQADQDKLNALMKERDSLLAAQTLQQYQTLARQIEEIAQAKGESFEEVIKEMGIDQAALEKGLGIKSDADFAAYMSQMQKQLDSAGENTTSIVTAINSGTQQLVLAITGKLPVNPHDISALATTTTSTTTDGTKVGARAVSNPGATQPGMKAGRTTTDEDVKANADAVGNALAKYLGPIVAQALSDQPRSRRALV
jgi:tape measure domain-containing protein